MVANQKDDLLRKIAGLMAKAEATEFESERQAFMQKADELMVKHSIELWELAQAGKGKVSERQPIIKDFDYSWAFESGGFPEIHEALWSLFISTASYATCAIVYHKQHYSGEKRAYQGNIVPVIGTEADLGYMSLLFTSLMMQLVDATHPKVSNNKSYEENLRTFREAGWGWLEVAAAMQQAGYDTDKSVSDARHKQAHAYRRYCKREGIEQNYANYKTYRRNFAEGFASTVALRLQEMRAQTAKNVGSGMEIALRDQREVNRDFMMGEFPSDGRRVGGSSMVKSRKFDSSAYSGGRSAGQKANITVNPGKGMRTPGRLQK
jgi:hypothetical protein